MAKQKKRSIFERLTGGIRLIEDEAPDLETRTLPVMPQQHAGAIADPWVEEEPEGELALDVYQTDSDIIVQTFVAGVRPDDLEINITRDVLSVRGKREESRAIKEGDFYTRELYWGSFSRTVSLPAEVEPQEAEAIERHGLLTIRVPKINKDKKANLKVKSL